VLKREKRILLGFTHLIPSLYLWRVLVRPASIVYESTRNKNWQNSFVFIAFQETGVSINSQMAPAAQTWRMWIFRNMSEMETVVLAGLFWWQDFQEE
jgi:hypothetical protein